MAVIIESNSKLASGIGNFNHFDKYNDYLDDRPDSAAVSDSVCIQLYLIQCVIVVQAC